MIQSIEISFAVLLLFGGVHASACDGAPNGQPKCAAAGNRINVITGNRPRPTCRRCPACWARKSSAHNSGLNGRHNTFGVLGRGWRLSYESELAAIGDTVQIRSPDDTRYIFSHDVLQPSLCNSNNPDAGTMTTRRIPAGEEFVWRRNDGRRLTSNPQGRLEQIQAPNGEFVSLQHDAARWSRSRILKATARC